MNADYLDDSVPKVSVALPVYNASSYLREAVDSILAQTYTDFELLAFDDGSTDDSLLILKEYESEDLRVKVFSRENRGLVVTLNEMIELARGRYIARMDADDVALPNRFDQQVKMLEDNTDIVCVGGAYELIDEQGRYLTTLYPPESDKKIQHLALCGHTPICHPCAMIRCEAIREIGGYDALCYLTEDLDLWLKLGEIGMLANIKDPVLRYRLNTDSISASNIDKQKEAAKRSCKNAWKRRDIDGNFEANENWRPVNSTDSRMIFNLKYGWWAWNSQQRKTAAIYGMKAIKENPFSLDGWKLFGCALVKPFDNSKSHF